MQLVRCPDSDRPATSPRAKLQLVAEGHRGSASRGIRDKNMYSEAVRCAVLQDCAVRMWDLRSMNCEGLLETPAKSAVAFDQQVRPPDP